MKEVPTVIDIDNARVLFKLGDSVTTDHISPAGAFDRNSSAGKYLMSLGVEPKMFNSYGSRRGNHEVMVRGTFANVRIKNEIGRASCKGKNVDRGAWGDLQERQRE